MLQYSPAQYFENVFVSFLQIKINIKVVDKDRHNHPVINAKISISIDNHKEFDVITNDKGEAMFDATTSMKNLSLQIVDADDSIQNPMFELQDEQYFLKEGNVHIKILEREVSLLKNIVSGFFFLEFTFYLFFSTRSILKLQVAPGSDNTVTFPYRLKLITLRNLSKHLMNTEAFNFVCLKVPKRLLPK